MTAAQRAWRIANRDKVLARQRARRAADPERYRAYDRAWKAAHRTSILAHARARREANPIRHWEKSLLYHYGITAFDYMRYLERQHYACGRCGGQLVSSRPSVDHDHDTGRVRGILCGKCNNMVHKLGEIELTLAYLDRTKESQWTTR